MLKLRFIYTKLIIWFLIALATIFIFSTILLSYWEPTLNNYIKNSVLTNTNNLYRLEFDDIGFNVFNGSVNFKNLQLIPNLSVYKDLKKERKHPRYLFNLYIQKFKVSGINLYELYFHKELQIDEINMNHPDVLVINDLLGEEQSDTNSKLRHPYELIKNELKSVQVDEINLKNINFEFISDSASLKKNHKLFLTYFKVRNLEIDSTSQQKTNRPFYADDIKVSIKNYELHFRDSVNKMQFEEVVASTATSSIEVYNFKILPLKDFDNYKSLNGFRKTRIDLYIREAKIYGVNFKKLFYEQKLDANNLEINKLNALIYQNKLIPYDPNKKRRFPSELVFDIKFPFNIKTVNIKNSNLDYSEKELKSKYTWNINFSSLNGYIKNFSNDLENLKSNQKVDINLECLFNKKAVSKFEFTLDYLEKDQPFYVRAQIGNYNLKDLNPILSNISLLEVANCEMRNLKFVIYGNKNQLHANLTMLYNNLRVRVLEKSEESNKVKKNAWHSFIANSVLLRNDNPMFNGKFIQPKFNLSYQNDYSFFKYIWKAVFKGIKESAGVTEKIERELKYRSDKAKESKANKEKRKTLKEIRKNKRLERESARAIKIDNDEMSKQL